jgi:hypothetical protein
MEQLLVEGVEKWEQPRTFSEILTDLPGSPASSEVEQGLESLIKRREIVSKTINCLGDGKSGDSNNKTSCTLYWKSTVKKSEFASPMSSLVVLTTPRSGIRPPSLKSRLPFKSPARIDDSKKTTSDSSVSNTPLSVRHTPRSSHKGEQCSEQLSRDVEKLKTQLKEIDRNIEELTESGCRDDELQLHIDALHEYNEIKDVGQMVLGKIAEIEGTTTTALYERFGLELDN